MSEVNSRVDAGFASGGKKVGNEWQRVAVILGDLVQTMVINTESEAAIFTKRTGAPCGGCLTDETRVKVFVNEVAECLDFYLGQLIHRRYR